MMKLNKTQFQEAKKEVAKKIINYDLSLLDLLNIRIYSFNTTFDDLTKIKTECTLKYTCNESDGDITVLLPEPSSLPAITLQSDIMDQIPSWLNTTDPWFRYLDKDEVYTLFKRLKKNKPNELNKLTPAIASQFMNLFIDYYDLFIEHDIDLLQKIIQYCIDGLYRFSSFMEFQKTILHLSKNPKYKKLFNNPSFIDNIDLSIKKEIMINLI